MIKATDELAWNRSASRTNAPAWKRTLGFVAEALFLAALLFTLPAQAGTDIFLALTDISGESQDTAYAGKIEVQAWSWGMTQSGTMHVGGGAGAGKVSVQDLTLTKYVDKASPKLMEACAKGSHKDEAVLTVRKSGDSTNTYIRITMKEVLVTAVSTGGSGGDDRLTENVTLNFAEVKFEYFATKPDGSEGPSIPFTWNIQTNSEGSL